MLSAQYAKLDDWVDRCPYNNKLDCLTSHRLRNDMNTDFIEELLNEDESTSLDFKREQYPFVGASAEEKSELLKDILAFGNAWRRTDAYILIGVEEVKGGRSKVVGIVDHLDEASLQQFVNGKTNRPIDFSYHALLFEGKQLGIIQIPLQERPFFLERKYGKLSANVVYIRRGSSTDCANPDEIAKMGARAVASRRVPFIHLEFAEVESRIRLGRNPVLESKVLVFPDTSQIPTVERGGLFTSVVEMANPDYYREFAEYLLLTELLNPIGFVLENAGTTTALNVRVEIVKPKEEGLLILDSSGYPIQPNYSMIPAVSRVGGLRNTLIAEDVTTVAETDRGWEISAKISSIQPKAEAWSEAFYVGSVQPCSIELEASIYADNLPEPLKVPLTLSFTTCRRTITVEEFKSIADSHR
jgi:hypothetical protein